MYYKSKFVSGKFSVELAKLPMGRNKGVQLAEKSGWR